MKKQTIGLLGLILLSAITLSACEKKGPAEELGERIDNAAENAGEKIESASEVAKEKVEEASEAVEEKLEAAGEKIEDATDKK